MTGFPTIKTRSVAPEFVPAETAEAAPGKSGGDLSPFPDDRLQPNRLAAEHVIATPCDKLRLPDRVKTPIRGPVICFSAGLKRIPGLDLFLGGPVTGPGWPALGGRAFPSRAARPRAVTVWGEKDGLSQRRARSFARREALPLWRLEDGFLRSLDLGGRGAAPLSLVLDRSGIYYDAGRPSDLEDLLNAEGWESPELLDQARAALAAVIEADLSKYNYAPPAPAGLLGDGSRRRILIIDQTLGDRSVTLGLAGPAEFKAMLLRARADHPEADIYIKSHPETVAGLKKGYLTPAGPRPAPGDIRRTMGLGFVGGDYSPLSLLAQADEVYTVSSQMGFEALMLGKTVHCFGLPFYAGWGLTQDEKVCPRRIRRRSLLELFAAAYLLYPRYINPIRGESTDIFEVIRLLKIQRETALENRGPWLVLGFSFWKRSQARAYLGSPGAEVVFGPRRPRAPNGALYRRAVISTYRKRVCDYMRRRKSVCPGSIVREQASVATGLSRELAGARDYRLLAWSSRLDAGQAEEGDSLIRMEDGFLRSAGLGCDLQRPYSLILDPLGIYYDPARPCRLEKILAEFDFEARPELLARAAALRRALVEAGISKYNQIGRKSWDFTRPAGRPVLLVPGQVEDDDSIKRGSPLVKSNLELLRLVRADRPEACLIYKPHPDVESGRRRGALDPALARQYADLVLTNTAPEALWPHIDEVHTLTSLIGFEALLRHKPVRTYGGPFYAGWGLTEDLMSFERRGRRLSLDELAAGALILYPRYYDWGSGLFGDPEDILHALARARPGDRRQNFLRHLAEEGRHLAGDFFRAFLKRKSGWTG